MAITAVVPNSFKLDQANGVHQPGDDYKIALFTSAATLNKATTAYAAPNEAAGTGYTAGGKSLTGRAASLDGDTAIIDFSDPVWANSSITARGCLIYNATRSNKAVVILDFGADVTSSNADFTVQFPLPAAATAMLRLA